jgi:hypothetical protein
MARGWKGCQKAVDCPIKDRDALVAFYDFPPEYWLHLRTINPIESTSATVRGTPLASSSANSGFHSGRSVTSPIEHATEASSFALMFKTSIGSGAHDGPSTVRLPGSP